MTSAVRTRLARVTDTQRRRFGYGVVAFIVAFVLVDIALAIADTDPGGVLETLLLGTTLTAVIIVSLRAQPRNGAVWTLTWASLFGMLSDAGGRIGEVLTDTTYTAIASGEVTDAPSSLPPLAAMGFAFASTLWIPGVFLLAIHLLILFPNGAAASPRWRRVTWVAGLTMAIMTVAGLVNTAPWVDRTYAEIFANDLSPGPFSYLMLVLMALSLAAAVHLVRRYRASEGAERLQYRWVTWALALFVLNIFFGYWLPGDLGPFVSTLVIANIGVSIGIAITRYGLYNIDLVVSRSFTYGALAAFIAGVYVAVVVGLGTVAGGDSSFALSIAATVLVAFLFQPVRRRVERWANRLVYGKRATPYEVLVRFSRRSSELSDEELLRRIPQLIADGTGAVEAVLWIGSESGFRSAATWPEGTSDRTLPASSQFIDPEADYSLPVFHDGELLGGISLSKAGGESITPAEETLLADLAAGLGLALRNAGLTRLLRNQVAVLQESRERILAAADNARRTLERDLDSGPQQELVALKVKLGPTKKLAEQAGAEKAAGLLSQLESEAGEAIQAVRDFAGGIYPPLLEADGLAAAIRQQAQRGALPVTVEADKIGRYPRDIEAAVYFTVLEALQNTAKYAEASSASVALRDGGEMLSFEVRDDGRGFDPGSIPTGAGLTGMADRIDTVGGSLSIASSPTSGTAVRGTIPITLEPADTRPAMEAV